MEDGPRPPSRPRPGIGSHKWSSSVWIVCCFLKSCLHSDSVVVRELRGTFRPAPAHHHTGPTTAPTGPAIISDPFPPPSMKQELLPYHLLLRCPIASRQGGYEFLLACALGRVSTSHNRHRLSPVWCSGSPGLLPLEPHTAGAPHCRAIVARSQGGGPMPACRQGSGVGSWKLGSTADASLTPQCRLAAEASMAEGQQKGPTLDGHACILVRGQPEPRCPPHEEAAG